MDTDLAVQEKVFPWRAGSIKSIKLINFMCHQSFELAFGPSVNFLIGPNGSGKSAISTAIITALGGRASITSRGRRMDEFIMYDKNYARITIVLHNYDKVSNKNQAFKPDEYGKTITVEKTLYKMDTAKLVLKDENGVKVSDRKSELDEMLDHFQILINNPICILNQEVSKTFLFSKKPEDKFELFVKATNLEAIENDYSAANQSRIGWEDCNSRNTVAFKMLDHDYSKCKERAEYLKNRFKMKDRIIELQEELLWAFVRDNEMKSEKLNSQREKIRKTIAEAQKGIEKRQEKISNCNTEIAAHRAAIQNRDERVVEARNKLERFRALKSDVKTRRMNVRQRLDRAKAEVERKKLNKLSLEKSIADIKRKFREQNELDQDNERRKVEIDSLDRELAHETAREKTLTLHTSQLGSSMTSTRTELHKAGMRVSELRNKVMQQKVTLRRLQNGQENVLRKYGDYIINVVDEIEKAYKVGKFKRRPLGPLGYHMKLKTPDVAPSLEVQLGRAAHAFTCDNQNDMTALMSIFRRFLPNGARQPLILTRTYKERHDISRFKAVHNVYKTLLDYLEIERDEVFNALLDRTSLETILFIPNYKDAENLMITPSMIPRNTRCAYTKDASVMYPRTASGGYKCIAHQATGSLFLESNSNQIRQQERELNLVEAELRAAEELHASHDVSYKSQRAEYDKNQAELSAIRKKLSEMEHILVKLKTQVVVEPQEISALESELESTVNEIERLGLTVEKEMEAFATIDKELNEVNGDEASAQQLLDTVENDRKEAEKILEGLEGTKRTFSGEVKEKEAIIRSITREDQEIEKELDATLRRIAETSQIANSTRPEEIGDAKDIEEKIKRIKIQMATEDADDLDPEEHLVQLRKRMEEIDNLNIQKDRNLKNYSTSAKLLMERHDGFLRLRSSTCAAVVTTFSTVMRAMKMDGRMEINLDDIIERGQVVRKAKTLNIYIDTNFTPTQRAGAVMSDNNNNNNSLMEAETSRRVSRSQPAVSGGPTKPRRSRVDASGRASEKENGSGVTDSRSLSGGERSFSTVAFVLSLWHHCHSPFKLMDEIDVFMDMVTRRVSYNALIRYAQANNGERGQFIFFSPLALPKFDESEGIVRVFEMPAIIRKRPHSQIAQEPLAVEE